MDYRKMKGYMISGAGVFAIATAIVCGPRTESVDLVVGKNAVAATCAREGLDECYLWDTNGDGHVDVVQSYRRALFARPESRSAGLPLLFDEKTMPIDPELQIALDKAYLTGLSATSTMEARYKSQMEARYKSQLP